MAPDHEYPSHLLLSVDVTDLGRPDRPRRGRAVPGDGHGGRVDLAGRDPDHGRGGDRGAAAGRRPGSSSRRSASRRRRRPSLGESTYAFDHWSDGGARTHGVHDRGRRDLGGRDLQAHRRQRDRSNTCATSPGAGRPVRSVAARPVREPRRRRLVPLQADLHDPGPARPRRPHRRRPDDAVQRLHARSSRSRTSGGTAPELIIRRLPAGSYAVRLAGSGGTASPTYSLPDAADAEHGPRPVRPRPDRRRRRSGWSVRSTTTRRAGSGR